MKKLVVARNFPSQHKVRKPHLEVSQQALGLMGLKSKITQFRFVTVGEKQLSELQEPRGTQRGLSIHVQW